MVLEGTPEKVAFVCKMNILEPLISLRNISFDLCYATPVFCSCDVLSGSGRGLSRKEVFRGMLHAAHTHTHTSQELAAQTETFAVE